MMEIPMNKLSARVVTIEETNELLAALETVKLWQLEIEHAEEARKKANEYLDQVITESLKHIPLKWMEGELVKVTNYNRLYCYFDNEFMRMPLSIPDAAPDKGVRLFKAYWR